MSFELMCDCITETRTIDMAGNVQEVTCNICRPQRADSTSNNSDATIKGLKNDLVMAGHDTEYLEIMVEDLMLLVSRLRADVAAAEPTVKPRRKSWAEGRYEACVATHGQFSEHGDAGPMHPEDRLKKHGRRKA